MSEELLIITPAVKSQFPGLKIGLAEIKCVRVQGRDQKTEEFYRHALQAVKSSQEELKGLPGFLAYREIYRKMGLDPRDQRPPLEARLARLDHGKKIYPENNIVDILSVMTIQEGISARALDLGQVKYPLCLRHSCAGEVFYGLGQRAAEELGNGELIYVDEQGQIIARDLNYLDSELTKVTFDTKDVLLCLDGTARHSLEDVNTALGRVIKTLIKYAGGKQGRRAVVT